MAHSYDWGMYYMQQNRGGKKARETEDTEIALSLDGGKPMTIPDELSSIPDVGQIPPPQQSHQSHQSQQSQQAPPQQSQPLSDAPLLPSMIHPSQAPLQPIPPVQMTPSAPEKKEIITNAGIYQVS
jgi:hypothetical protein